MLMAGKTYMTSDQGEAGCAMHMQYRYVPLSHLMPAYQQTWQHMCLKCSKPLSLAELILL